MSSLRDYLPQLSLAERDRRWVAVRTCLAERNLDVLLAPANSGRWEQLQADARYLSCIGGNATETFVLFPREGEPTAMVMNRAGWWKQAQGWVADVRDCRNRWAEYVGTWIAERGYEGARFGIGGLSGLSRSPDGIVASGTLAGLQQRFPRASFESATDFMLDLRAVKSAEEIGCLERSIGLVERGIVAMAETARPGVPECEVYAAVWHAMVGNGGEFPSLLFISGGPNLNGSAFVPTMRPLAVGDVILNELEIRWAGYGAQANQPMFIGEPTAQQREAYAVGLRAFDAVLGAMRPGITFGELADVYAASVAGTPYHAGFPLLHARGLGDDIPILVGGDDLERFRGTQLVPGMVFVLKPHISYPEGGSLTIGDTVAVTETGARRLGKRSMEPLVWS